MSIELIAEIGWNHMGNMEVATKMIESAAKAGADYAKFQTWKVDRLTPGPWDHDGRRQIYEQAELTEERHKLLKNICVANNIKFLTSCFSSRDLNLIKQFTDELKIPGTESSNKELTSAAIKMFKRIFISTGTAKRDEYEYLAKFDNVILLHCISSYPCDSCNFHPNKMNFIKSISKQWGFSGHSPTIWDAVVAIASGATIVEKHFTIDHELPGRDNQFAILPDEMAELRKFADYFEESQVNCSIDNMLPCENDQRKYQKGRWDG